MEIILTDNMKDMFEEQNAENTVWKLEKYPEPDGECRFTVKHGQAEDGDEVLDVEGYKIAVPKDVIDEYKKLTLDYNKGAYEGGVHVKAEK